MGADEIEVVAKALAEADDPGSWNRPDAFGQMEIRQHYRALAKVAIATLQRVQSDRRQQSVRLLRPDAGPNPSSRDGENQQ